jgi:hypothetical protein
MGIVVGWDWGYQRADKVARVPAEGECEPVGVAVRLTLSVSGWPMAYGWHLLRQGMNIVTGHEHDWLACSCGLSHTLSVA